jgi:hypothetical protein
MSGTIGGAVALGVSLLFSIILALVFVYCLKNNNVDEQRSVPHHNKHMRHQKQHRQRTREQTSSHEITVISGVHKFDNQQQQHSSNGHDYNHVSPPIQSFALADSTNAGYGRQLPHSPSKTSSFQFNQGNGSTYNQNQQSNIKRENYNRH